VTREAFASGRALALLLLQGDEVGWNDHGWLSWRIRTRPY
jgi:hypothetical protein